MPRSVALLIAFQLAAVPVAATAQQSNSVTRFKQLVQWYSKNATQAKVIGYSVKKSTSRISPLIGGIVYLCTGPYGRDNAECRARYVYNERKWKLSRVICRDADSTEWYPLRPSSYWERCADELPSE